MTNAIIENNKFVSLTYRILA